MLHIHNGDSTANTLKEFGFPGEHFAFHEVLMVGRTRQGLSPGDWRRLRAKVLSDEYELKIEECERDLLNQDETLRRFSEHEEVVLWFEHDLFCQINLIYLLDWFSKQSLRTTRLSLICVGKFPGIEDFRGLGQLTGEQLASLFAERHEVTKVELVIAARAWATYCSNDPNDIARVLGEDTSAMPFLGNAVRLHLTRFPSVRNGLGRIETKALEMISDGAIGFKSLFPRFASSHPDYGIGDAQFWCELKRMGKAREPLVTIDGLKDWDNAFKLTRYHEASFEMTETGRAVLAGERDFVEINGIDLWLGGVLLVGSEAVWRWHEQERQLVHDS